MDIGKRIGKRLRELRGQRGWTQLEFAQMTGKAVETISNMERGKSIPSLMTLEQFARCFGIGVDELMGTVRADVSSRSRHALTVAAAIPRLSEDELEMVAGFIGLLDKRRRRSRRPSSKS